MPSGRCSPQLQGERLPEWIAAVRADDLPSLHTFVNRLERDLAARHSPPDPAHLERGRRGRSRQLHQYIKRQLYARAGFKRLRKRALLAS
ncbi:hypothetical protein [Streptomyces sp. NPDC056069]|uniref:hypothetical protein n=1 Tax=Streptomyces sp. NPDC056069 TaxID=3345702 RepID=UPI0035DD72C2